VLEFDPSLSLEGIRVLVVDDNPTARLIAKEQLVAEGCAVVTPESSQEALRLIEAGEHFDAALIDYSMPGMDGMELVKQIKASPSHAQLPVIMVTAMPMREGSQSIQQAGLSGYLCKPLAHQLLREAMLCVVHAKQSGEPLPFITLHSLRESRGSVAAPASRSIALGHARALLAEDNLVNQTVAVKMLERYGFEVVAVHDGQQAVQCFKEDGAFDLVFMDCQMPVMDGYEATAHIRAIETASSRARTPVIAFTANAIKGDDQKCFDAGMDDYLSKPIDLSALEKLLKKWTRQDNRISAVRSAEPTDSEGGAATLNEAVFKRFSDMVGSELRPLMKAHQASCEQYLRELNAALDNKDMAALARAAHTLKSSSANLGAARTVELARRLESMARGKVQDTEELRSLAQALEAETHRSSRAILSRMAGS
jgi:CheY-like chemotaxis protein